MRFINNNNQNINLVNRPVSLEESLLIRDLCPFQFHVLFLFRVPLAPFPFPAHIPNRHCHLIYFVRYVFLFVVTKE